MTSGFPPYKWYTTPAQVAIDLKKQPQNHAMFIPQVHCIMKLREFESTHYFWMISNSVPIYFTYFTYAWSRCLKPKYGPPINIHPKSGHSSYGDHTFLEPPKIQNSNWESLQKKTELCNVGTPVVKSEFSNIDHFGSKKNANSRILLGNLQVCHETQTSWKSIPGNIGKEQRCYTIGATNNLDIHMEQITI